MDKKQALIENKKLLRSGSSIFSYYGENAENFAESFDENIEHQLRCDGQDDTGDQTNRCYD